MITDQLQYCHGLAFPWLSPQGRRRSPCRTPLRSRMPQAGKRSPTLMACADAPPTSPHIC
jgi:hypothetical protein